MNIVTCRWTDMMQAGTLLPPSAFESHVSHHHWRDYQLHKPAACSVLIQKKHCWTQHNTTATGVCLLPFIIITNNKKTQNYITN